MYGERGLKRRGKASKFAFLAQGRGDLVKHGLAIDTNRCKRREPAAGAQLGVTRGLDWSGTASRRRRIGPAVGRIPF